MPAAALPIAKTVAGAAGGAASGASGKKSANKGNQLAQQQQQLQQNQFGLTKNQYAQGNAAISPAASFWTDLLKGGQAAQQATGPYAALIGQAGQGARQQILGSTPRGGEQNLALAENVNNQSNNIARLYAGMQPTAANNLQQLAATYFGSGAGVNPNANTGAAAQNYLQQQAMSQQAGQGFGGLLYNGVQGIQNGKQGKNAGTGSMG